MAKWWTLAVLLALGQAAHAQYLPPMGPMSPTGVGEAPVGGPPMPVAASAMHGSYASPGLGHPAGHPAGHAPPDSPLSLSCYGLNAWNDDGYSSHVEGIYGAFGVMVLFRSDLGHSVLALRDPLGTGDSSVLPPRNSAIAFDFHDVDPRPIYGIRGTFGYRYGPHAIELTGFFMPHNTTTHVVGQPGRLDVPFILPPLGFEGNNNLWLNADRVEARYAADFGNIEFNYRAAALGGIDCIVGVRYVDYKDFFGIRTDDDGITLGPDPLNVADYRVSSHTHFIGPQLGFECAHHCCSDHVAMGLVAKGAWGINFNDVNVDLERGDGLSRSARRSQEIFSQVYELAFFADCYTCDQVKVRLGYHLYFLSNFPQAHEQVGFDLSNLTGHRRDQSLVFWHGPMIEVGVQF